MASNLDRIMALEVPIIVRLGERPMSLGEVVSMVPGMIIELPKNAEEELDLMVNNKAIGSGIAVKVGENFGIKVSFIGDLAARIRAMGPGEGAGEAGVSDDDAAALAAQLLSGR